MNFIPQPEPAPLYQDKDGAIRVQGTRVLLDLIVRAFENGTSPEKIVQQYDSLSLANTYAVIAFYLSHKTDVEDYLTQREKEAEEIRKEIEATQPDLSHVREKMVRFRANRN